MKNVSKIIELIKSEKIISIISDAGTPMISDPGKIIVNACIKNKINIYPMPGPSAVTSAISISGFSEKYFFLMVFFPLKTKRFIE
jgi:Predicted methyltransferases